MQNSLALLFVKLVLHRSISNNYRFELIKI